MEDRAKELFEYVMEVVHGEVGSAITMLEEALSTIDQLEDEQSKVELEEIVSKAILQLESVVS